MDHARFWSLIDAARRAPDSTSAALERALAELSGDEIVRFDAWLWAYRFALERQDLWAAAYVIRGGCSDDAFTYFRAWLIAQGEAAVLAAVRDPESIDGMGDGALQDESMLYVASRAYERALGAEMPDRNPRVEIPGLADWPPDRLPRGVKWTRELLAERFPRLWEKHGWPPEPTGSIEHARFWELIEEARGRRAAPTAASFVDAFIAVLRELPESERIGAVRWVQAYNHALVRRDLRAVSRVVLGDDDSEAFAAFRGWLITQGREVVHAFVRDVDALSSIARDPIERCQALIHLGSDPRLGVYVGYGEEQLEVPGAAEWPADWAEDVRGAYTPELLRARLPRLTADRTDASLTGECDPLALPYGEAARRAAQCVKSAASVSETGNHERALQLLDRAVHLAPTSAETLAPRARARLALGDVEGALADLDAAIEHAPRAAPALLDRAKIKLSRGDHAGAIADAERAAALDHLPARTWLSLHRVTAQPTRARHAKFGEGTIVSIEGEGEQQKVTVDFPIGRKTLLRRFLELA